MKMLISMLFTAGIILFSTYYMMNNMGGIPGIPGMGAGSTGKASEGIKELGNAVLQKDVTVYQWTDSAGIKHYGGTPPTGQGEYETKTIHSNTNIMQAQKRIEEEEKPEQKSRMALIGSAYSPEGVKGLMDDTKDIQEQMNNRMAEQQKLLDSITNPANKK